MKYFFVILIFFLSRVSFAQLTAEEKKQIDSLKFVISNAGHDTTVVNAYVMWDNLIYGYDPELDFELNKKIAAICADNLRKKLRKDEKLIFLKQQSFAFNGLGIYYTNKGDYAQSIVYYNKALVIKENLGDKKGIAACLNNIGLIYQRQDDHVNSLPYFLKSLAFSEETENKEGISSVSNNLGNNYTALKEYNRAFDYYNKSISFSKEINDSIGIAMALNNLGNIYKETGDYSRALIYHDSALIIFKDINFRTGIAETLIHLGTAYELSGNHLQSISNSSKGLEIAGQLGNALDVEKAAITLYKSYKATGNYKMSLDMFELYISTRDSSQSEKNQKEVLRQEYKYQYEKQAMADSIKNADAQKVKDAEIAQQKVLSEKQEIEINNRQIIQYALFGGLALVLMFALFIFNRFRITQKQKAIIELKEKETQHQKEIIEEKNKEIVDSINYAKRIQSAILPEEKEFISHFKEAFVLLKPKDIVSGDFYWIAEAESSGTSSGNFIFMATADCTGHGVPGGFMSMLGTSFLNEIVLEKNILEPAEILIELREKIIAALKQTANVGENKDGMDIVLIRYDLKKNELIYSSANNDFYLIRNGELHFFKPDKQPIGFYNNEKKPFTQHVVGLIKNDCVFTFTDGYADQFGGKKGKKLKYKNLEEILLKNHTLPFNEQKEIYNSFIENWRGELEQNDDICLIGIKI